MKKYMKPDFDVTAFEVNNYCASCDRLVTGTQTDTVYEQQTVRCLIGGQAETVFNTASGCHTSASSWGVYNYDGTMYFYWYAVDKGSGRPDETAVALMNRVLRAAGVTATNGEYQNWHFCEVTGRDIVTDILGFSY